jgi:hypothetical protein
MRSATSKNTSGDTSRSSTPADGERTDAQWDEFMQAEGFHSSTLQESRKFAKFFAPCPASEREKHQNKIIDLVRVLQDALKRITGRR